MVSSLRNSMVMDSGGALGSVLCKTSSRLQGLRVKRARMVVVVVVSGRLIVVTDA